MTEVGRVFGWENSLSPLRTPAVRLRGERRLNFRRNAFSAPISVPVGSSIGLKSGL